MQPPTKQTKEDIKKIIPKAGNDCDYCAYIKAINNNT